MTASTAARVTPRERDRLVSRLTTASGAGMLVLFLLTALDVAGQAVLWENAHWTLTSAVSAALAALALRHAVSDERPARMAIAVGFGMYFGGQLAWLIQVALNLVTVPAGSDLLFLSSAIPIGWGFVTLLRSTMTAAERVAFGLDAALLVSIIVLVLGIAFGPTALLATAPLAGAILILYPTAFLGVAGLVVLAAVRASVVASTGMAALILGLAGTGLAWVAWMSEAVTTIPAAGSAVNFVFSVAWLAAGVGASRMSMIRRDDATIRRLRVAVATLFPMAAVGIAIGSVMVVEQLRSEAMDGVVQLASAVIVIVALIRQTLLMREYQRLAEQDRRHGAAERLARAQAEEAAARHFASERRYRDVVDVFARLGEQLSFSADESSLIRGGVAALRRLVSTDGGDLLLANASQDRLVVGSTWGSLGRSSGAEVDGIAPVACLGIRRGSIYHVADVTDDLVLSCPAHPIEGGSLMCVPMLALGQTIGVVHLAAEGPGAFSVDDERQAQRVAEQVALAIANARLLRTMENMALSDPLTRLHNARYFDPFLERELARSQRDGDPLGVIMIDLDHFKAFNDEYGHAAGDEALRSFARAALTVLRDSDTLARYGGEEFVVAVRDAGVEAAAAVAERLRIAVEGASIEVGLGRYASITASFGVASTTMHGHDRLRLMKHADRALYRAKQEGRNRVATAGAPRPNLRRNGAGSRSAAERRAQAG